MEATVLYGARDVGLKIVPNRRAIDAARDHQHGLSEDEAMANAPSTTNDRTRPYASRRRATQSAMFIGLAVLLSALRSRAGFKFRH